MKNKKITFLISSLAGGGAEGVCVNIANGLADVNWNVTLVVLHMNNSVYHDRLNKKINLVTLDVKHARYAAPALLKYIRKAQPSKVLVFNYELAVLLVVLRSLFFIKLKVIARNINTFSQNTTQGKGVWQKYIVRPLINHFYCKVDHVVNQCEAMRNDLLSVYPQLVKRSSVIYNPVASHIEAHASTVDFNNVEKQDYLLCVGRLEKQKAFHLAIEAFSLFVNANPESQIRLKIVGQGSLLSDLKKLTVVLNVTGRVDFEGFQKEMMPYYLNAKATLLTSLYEGFPNALIESITLGTPVVAFDCKSGPREIIKNGCNGYIAEDKNVQDLSDKIYMLLQQSLAQKKVQKTAVKYKNKSAIELWKQHLTKC